MVDVNPQRLQGIVASMMERQVQEMKAPPSGLIGGIWEKATGEIQKYNEAVEEHVKLKTKHDKVLLKLRRTQEQVDELTRRLRDNIFEEGETAESTRQKIDKLNDSLESLTEQSDEMAESVNTSGESLRMMNEGGGILRNGMTALAVKVGGAAASFFGMREAVGAVDDRLKLASKSVQQMGVVTGESQSITGGYIDTMTRVKDAAWEWNEAITSSTWEMMKFGVGAEETRNIIGSLSEGLRHTTANQGDLIANTKQMTEDVGFLSKLMGVSTEELASATVDASKRFGKSTTSMADDLAGLYTSIQTIKAGSRDTVMSFSDLTRATLEAQSSFQGYNFNLRATANVLGNVVAKAQEQGATYEMSMKAAQGLAGVITGGKAPDWAKYIAGKKLKNELVDVVNEAKKANEKLGVTGEEANKRIADSLRGAFGKDMSDQQVKGLANLAENYKKYGALSSAKMAEELLRGTERSNEEMFKMMKQQADRPEGRELLMRVWGLDEAAATAATLALNSAESVEDFTKIQQEAKAATAARKPVSAADLKAQTEGFATAIGGAEAGISGMLQNVIDAIKASPLAGAAVSGAGMAATIGTQALQMGIGSAIGKAIGSSRIGQGAANLFGGMGRRAGALRAATTGRGPTVTEAFGRARAATTGRGPTVGEAFGRLRGATTGRGPTVGEAFGRARGVAGRGVEGVGRVMTDAAGSFKDAAGKAGGALKSTLTRAGRGIGTAMGTIGKAASSAGGAMAGMGKAALPLLGKAGLVGLAGAAGVAVGSMIRLIPGVDEFTEGLINAGAKLLGFEGALDDAETAQAALNNKSEGVQKAIQQVTTGITSDYEKDSNARMKAVYMLQHATKEDIAAYAKKAAETGKISEKEAMVRLEKLSSEKVDHAKWRKLREDEEKKKLATEKAGSAETLKERLAAAQKQAAAELAGSSELMKTRQDAAKRQVAVESAGSSELMKSRQDTAKQTADQQLSSAADVVQARLDAEKEAAERRPRRDRARRPQQPKRQREPSRRDAAADVADRLDKTATALLTPKTQQPPAPTQMPVVMPIARDTQTTRLPEPSALPESPQKRREARQREQERRRQRGQQAAQQPRTGGASVRPDGTISLNIMIPRDALDQSNTQSAGYAE